MKLVVAIVKDSDAMHVSDALVAQEFRVTRIASTGGFLRRGNVTLLVGVDEDAVDTVLDILREHCRPPDTRGAYRATVFVLPAEDFVQVG